MALRTVLEPLGRELVTAPSGEEALKRLLQDDFSVIVIDVRMPGLDGFETVELIKQRERHEDTAVIFVTAGDADTEQVTRGYSDGAVDYMLKPFDPDMLRSKVAMLLELQQKSAELRASEERFRAAFEGAPIGMGLSTVHGRWLEVNDALCELLGRTQTQLLRQPLWDLVHPADRETERDAVRRLLHDRPLFDQSEKRFMRNDGEIVHAMVSVSLTADSHDRPQGYIWQVVDVTEQRRAEAERAARAEAEAVIQTIGKSAAGNRGGARAPRPGRAAPGAGRPRRRGLRARTPSASCCARTTTTSGSPWARPSGSRPRPVLPVTLGSALEEVVERSRPVTIHDLPASAGLDPDLEAARRLLADRVAADGQGPARGTGGGGRARCATLHARGREPPDPDGRPRGPGDRARARVRARALERRDAPAQPAAGPAAAARRHPGGGPLHARVAPTWAATGTTPSRSRAGAWAWRMGDVVGHGIAAAALMGQLRHAMRAYALEGHPPAGVLDRLDRVVRSFDGGQMATLLYLVIEPDQRTGRGSRAPATCRRS